MRSRMKDFDAAGDADNVPSPCIDVCRMNAETALCEGCSRTIDEIAAWGGAGNEERRAIWTLIRQRRAAST
ncbi:MAG: hypothetical protein JWR25_987 [Noviherbaspirillum sp.]|nr:hypothetical protein [Noviherbaspirillum sp.]MDB5794608.1 hypothetical protein [Noviherbaspirillum sp.]